LGCTKNIRNNCIGNAEYFMRFKKRNFPDSKNSYKVNEFLIKNFVGVEIDRKLRFTKKLVVEMHCRCILYYEFEKPNFSKFTN
jgi:hypothetical protein